MARENWPNPSSVDTPWTAFSRASPPSLVKVLAGRGIQPGGQASQPSGATSSLAPSRASAAPSRSGSHSSSSIRPVEISQAAIPQAPRTSQIAASTLARRGSSRASSVKVPAVTNRTMSRATSAFDPPRRFASSGVSTCSAIATRQPALISRARYPSAEWTGTPHIGIGIPICSPRLVSAMSRIWAACLASSKNSSKKSPIR